MESIINGWAWLNELDGRYTFYLSLVWAVIVVLAVILSELKNTGVNMYLHPVYGSALFIGSFVISIGVDHYLS